MFITMDVGTLLVGFAIGLGTGMLVYLIIQQRGK